MDLTDLTMMLSTIQTDPTEEEFQLALETAQALALRLDDEQRLCLYGLFKQCKEGDAPLEYKSTSVVDDMKWKAWLNFRGFPPIDARKAYIYLVNEISRESSSSEAFHGMGSSVSTLYCKEHEDQDLESIPELLKYVLKNDIDGAKAYILAGGDVHVKDENGLTALHHAADRGNTEMCELLLANGADVHSKDQDDLTPLDYAITCEHNEVVELLSKISN